MLKPNDTAFYCLYKGNRIGLEIEVHEVVIHEIDYEKDVIAKVSGREIGKRSIELGVLYSTEEEAVTPWRKAIQVLKESGAKGYVLILIIRNEILSR